MRPEHLQLLRCPRTGSALTLRADEMVDGRVRSGALRDSTDAHEYPIVGFIPRFVTSDNYAENFGFQWNLHRATQLDAESGIDLSRRRFREETRWPDRLDGEVVLEAGSGAGRFTGYAVATGATVVSFDYSRAVEANYLSNGGSPNLLIVQADIFSMPFAPGSFDRVFCFGVLQHTPDPARAFRSVAAMPKPGGTLAIDVYKKKWHTYLHLTKYWVRPVTKRMDPERLYRLVVRYTDFMWPLATQLRRIPFWGIQLNWRLLIADHSHLGVPEQHLKQWAYLDTFDMLGPAHDHPQTLATVRRWFAEAGYGDCDVHYGHNGIEGRGTRRGAATPPEPPGPGTHEPHGAVSPAG